MARETYRDQRILKAMKTEVSDANAGLSVDGGFCYEARIKGPPL